MYSKGFSLYEVMVTFFIMSLMLSFVYKTYFNIKIHEHHARDYYEKSQQMMSEFQYAEATRHEYQ